MAETGELYRVRKSWEDVKSQQGAYQVLENAKNLADSLTGYKVYNSKGIMVYNPAQNKPAPINSHKNHVNIMDPFTIDSMKMAAFVKNTNPNAKDIEAIAHAFVEVGKNYGVRGDIAFCQSILETGWFRFENTAVTPDQHNYSGLGVTSNGKKGHSFTSIEEGVTAQIQHLFAYATENRSFPPGEPLVDPRFNYVNRGSAPHWEDLGTKWSSDPSYGERIVNIYEKLVAFKYTAPKSDYETHPAKAAIEKVINYHILTTDHSGNFYPDQTITKADLASALAKTLGLLGK